MRLLINFFSALIFAVTGFLAFYLVIIHFIEHMTDANRLQLWFHIGCSVLLATGGAIVQWRKRLGAIIVIFCLLALLSIWLGYTDLPFGSKPPYELPESAPTIRKFFPAAYSLSAVFAVIQLLTPAKNH